MADQSLTCGTALMRLVRKYGTDVVFGIPGVHTLELYRGISEAGIQHITPRHEQSAGFMADGYARATGRVGVCCLITGPGVTNAATAIAQAYSDSVPMLVISSVNRTASLGMGQGDLHEVPGQQALTEHFTEFSHTVLDVDSLPELIARAYSVYDTSRPRPVHIEIPIDLIGQPVSWQPSAASRLIAPNAPGQVLEQAAALLSEAANPAVILGGGAINASVEAERLVKLLNSPVVTTFSAKGVISEDHPLSLGANLLHPPVLDFLQQSDVVLAVGTHLSETDIWSRGGDIRFDGSLIRIDLDRGQLYRNAMPELGIVGDARHALGQLAEQLLPLAGDGSQRVRDEKAQLVQDLLQRTRPHWYENTPLHLEVWDAIRSALPDDGIVTADSTQLVYSGNYCYRARLPRTYLTSTTGYGTLGYALPAAIGAKIGRPDSPIVCVAGDGGLMFSIQELATAVEHQLPIVVLLWNNEGYGEIRDNFRQSEIPLIGVDLKMPDFISVAQGFGCSALRLERLRDLPQIMQEGFRSNRPTLVEVRPEVID
ncbi:MAG: 5-guanidino-2-oxopentanoate decarboxylase [Acidiferrobacterales bacterium]|nr:5-guanidino-2-oxopentanoate decarboxylase [Acidiferrobacterales bacterium]